MQRAGFQRFPKEEGGVGADCWSLEYRPPPTWESRGSLLQGSPQFSALVGKTRVSCPLFQELRKDKMAEAYSEIGMKSDVSVALSLFPGLGGVGDVPESPIPSSYHLQKPMGRPPEAMVNPAVSSLDRM